jgi:2,4-dienoyl-CoA reductase-like NADH-dependent reductase (Old Yellow Enzyme family)
VVARFAASISRAMEAGFDGVEIHGAHGFLLNAFLSPTTSKRDDEYGGSAARRATVIAKIVAAARRKVGPHYPILIKVSCNDQGEDESAMAGFAETVGEIEQAGVDAVDVSGRDPVRTAIDGPAKEAYFLPLRLARRPPPTRASRATPRERPAPA